MVVVFVARDPGELTRYKKDLGDAPRFDTWSIEDAEKDTTWRDSPEMSPDQKLKAIKLRKRIQEFRRHKIKYHCETIGDADKKDHVILLDGIPQKDTAVASKFSEEYVNVYLDIFSGIAKKVVGQVIDDNQIFVFVHWGTVSPSEYENLFRAAIKRSCHKHKNVNMFAVSSTRPQYFDVSCEKIQLPKTHHEIQDIILRFTYDMVKDKFSDYIWSEQIEVTEDDVSQMDFYLNGWMLPKLKEIAVSKDVWKVDAIKVWNEVKCNGYVDDKRKRVLTRDKRVVALFSELIQNGGAI